jgi:hypothetical protein
MAGVIGLRSVGMNDSGNERNPERVRVPPGAKEEWKSQKSCWGTEKAER